MIDQHQAPDCRHSELAVGWALHALEPAEEILVAAHLPECDVCTRTVADTELVGATLGLSVPEQAPSAALEQRVLAVTSTPQVPPAPAEPAPAEPPAESSEPEPPRAEPGRAEPAEIPPPAPRSPSWATPPRRPRPPARRPRGRGSRDPLCVPEILKLVAVAVLVLALAAAMVFFALP